MRPLQTMLAVVTLVQVAVCTVAPTVVQAQAAAEAPAAKPPKPKANLISEEEIAVLGGTIQTAYGIVQRLRPAMFRIRSGSAARESNGSSSMDTGTNEIQVYLDNQRMGGVRALDDITLSQIREIRYLNASDATTLFGTGNSAGAIQVIGKR